MFSFALWESFVGFGQTFMNKPRFSLESAKCVCAFLLDPFLCVGCAGLFFWFFLAFCVWLIIQKAPM
jgi:hypothetical protein